MPTLEYPQPIAAPHGPFSAIADIQKPPEDPQEAMRRRQAVLHLGEGNVGVANLRRAPSPLIGVTKLHVSVGGDHSTSFHNGADTDKADVALACVFCPDEDVATVSWKVRHHVHIATAKLVVEAARLGTPVSVKDVTAELANGRGVAPGCTGGLPLTEAIEIRPEHAHRFPDDVLTAEYAPYRFKLVIVPKRGINRAAYPTEAWTFAQVLVHSISLNWGEQGHVPAGPQPGVIDPLGDDRFKRLERDLVTNLVQHGDITAKNDLVLDTNAFAATWIDTAGAVMSPIKNNANALAMLWGDGPRIPLEATVFARKHDGSAASLNASKKAVGRVTLLWDWEGAGDPLVDWLAAAKPGFTYISDETLRRLVGQPEPVGPLLSYNCSYAYGGKRGSTAKPVFLEQNDQTVWGNEVRLAGGARPWCSVSQTGSGLRRAKSTVMFQPAPIIGDRYRVAVYLTHDHYDRTPDAFPEVNVADTPSPPPIGNAPRVPPTLLRDKWRRPAPDKRVPRVETGVFEIKRRAKVRLVEYPAGAANAVIAGLRAYYDGLLGMDLDIDQVTLQAPALQAALPGWWTTNAFNLSLAHYWAIDRANSPGAQALICLTYLQFQAKVQAHFRFGKLYEAELDAAPNLGSVSSVAKNIFVWASVAAAGPNPARGIYGSADAAQDIVEGDVNNTRRWRRCCFSGFVPVAQNDPNAGNHEIFLDLTAAGQTETVHVTWSKVHVGKRKVGKRTKREIRDALANLVAHLGAGPYDVQLDVVLRGKTTNNAVTAWVPVVRTAAREVFDEHYVVLDPPTLRNDFFTGRYNGKAEALSQTVYEAAAVKVIKDLMIPISDRLRLVEQGAFAGLVYLCIAPASNLGNFGIGGNNTGGRMGSGYVTEFPVGGFAQQLMMPFADVLGHELGHAFFRMGHAFTASFGFAPGDDSAKHTSHDTCLMNYDVEPHSMNFCAHCVLQLRGWRDLDMPLSRAEAVQLLEAEILAETSARAKAWKELRRARLEPIGTKEAIEDERKAAETAWNQGDRATANNRAATGRANATTSQNAAAAARNWIAQAEATCAGNFAGAEGISLLRALIRAYLWASDYSNAWRLWQQLLGMTALYADMWDSDSSMQPMLPGIVQTIEITEGVNHLNAPVVQCINLAADQKYVDGNVVAHIDRLGRRVRLYVTTTGPVGGPNAIIKWALLRHQQDGLAPHETVVTEPFGRADPHFTGAVRIEGVVMGAGGTVRIDNTHFSLEFDLPERGGRYKVAIAGAGGTVLSPEIRAVRVMFLMTTVVQGNAAANATPDGPAIADLNTAYANAGVRFVHVGRTTLNWPGGVYADDLDGNVKATPFAVAAHGQRTANAAAPFTHLFNTYEEHAAHMVQAVFVESLSRWAGTRTHAAAVDLTLAAPTHTFNVVMKGNFPAEVWQGDPADADPDAGGLAPQYVGRGTGKRWVVQATFTPNGGVAQPVPLANITANAADPVGYPGKLDRVVVDLTPFADIAGNIQGQLVLVLVTVKFVAGVDASAFAPARGMTILVTDTAAPVQRSALIHEIGHMLGLVEAGGRHPTHYNIGSGPHCHAGFAKFGGGGLGDAYYPTQIASATCVMYHRVRVAAPILTLCDNCMYEAGASTWRSFQ